ncbi:hypothetical protein NDU88_007954 [Pleurodeles waltl]|uniref:Uncharacterized protein n=1 Tax=Pleurodeles waltl TaxID=8319 RepID=A0AAV7VUY8_PLEWA|nr:hypothetical protein NDU88_007954 [Pleurodeles waltl]
MQLARKAVLHKDLDEWQWSAAPPREGPLVEDTPSDNASSPGNRTANQPGTAFIVRTDPQRNVACLPTARRGALRADFCGPRDPGRRDPKWRRTAEAAFLGLQGKRRVAVTARHGSAAGLELGLGARIIWGDPRGLGALDPSPPSTAGS